MKTSNGRVNNKSVCFSLTSQQVACCLFSALLLGACSGERQENPEDIADNAPLSFDEYEKATEREPETGYYLIGDQIFPTKHDLRQYYDTLGQDGALIVHQPGGVLAFWDNATKKNLTYCVSTGFGSNYNTVVSTMNAVAGVWEAQADINFIHDTSQDGSCTASNNNVIFDVSPAPTAASYYARAFFPNYARVFRNVLIHSSAFTIAPPITFGGVIRHELGHTLGFRHEHTRPESATCFEDSAWRILTPYDSASVMHYPWCNGANTGDLNLTSYDARGAAILYGKNGYFRLRHEQTGKCAFGNTQDGGAVKNWGCWNDPNMVYNMDPLSNSQFRLRHAITQKCIYGNTQDGGSANNWVCWNDPNMVYNMDPVADNRFRLRHQQTGKCLFGNPQDGGAVKNWGCWNDPNMVFSLEPTGPNQARAATVTVPSSYPGYSELRINDGDTNTSLGGAYSWANAYIYGPNGLLPQNVDLTWSNPRTLNMVVIYTSQGYPIQEYDLQYWSGSTWVPLISITGNTALQRIHVFPTIATQQLRVIGRKGPNHQTVYARLNEVEVY